MPKLDQVLSELAAKLGTTVPYLWQVLLRQARVELIEDALFVLLTIAVVYAYVRGFRYFYIRGEGELWDEFDSFAFTMVGGVIAFAFLIVGLICLFEIPTLVFNPPYWALQQLLNK